MITTRGVTLLQKFNCAKRTWRIAKRTWNGFLYAANANPVRFGQKNSPAEAGPSQGGRLKLAYGIISSFSFSVSAFRVAAASAPETAGAAAAAAAVLSAKLL